MSTRHTEDRSRQSSVDIIIETNTILPTSHTLICYDASDGCRSALVTSKLPSHVLPCSTMCEAEIREV